MLLQMMNITHNKYSLSIITHYFYQTRSFNSAAVQKTAKYFHNIPNNLKNCRSQCCSLFNNSVILSNDANTLYCGISSAHQTRQFTEDKDEAKTLATILNKVNGAPLMINSYSNVSMKLLCMLSVKY